MGLDVVSGGVLGVLCRVRVVTVGKVRVMRSRLVVALGVVPGGFAVMARSVLVVLRCLRVMMSSLLGHM